MRELFFKLFRMSYFDTGISVTAFSVSHLIYFTLIFGLVILGHFMLHNRPMANKIKALRLLAYAIAFSYLSDFFFHEFVYGGLNTDKLPFHICTVLCPLACFAQFNHNGKKILEPVAILAVIAPMMYLCYPANIGSGEPWCYQAVQTMFYHGVLMGWGILTLSLGVIEPQIKDSWKLAIMLAGITLWAKLGNILLEHNWFFLEEDAFYIGLVENGVIPKWSLMIANPVAFYLVALIIYGICHLATKKKRALVNS